MKAMLVENEKLVLTEVATPEVKADEIRIKIKAIGIKIRKSGMYVCINGKIKPVWEKENWDMCSLIGELFDYTGIECNLEDYIVDEIEDMGKLF